MKSNIIPYALALSLWLSQPALSNTWTNGCIEWNLATYQSRALTISNLINFKALEKTKISWVPISRTVYTCNREIWIKIQLILEKTSNISKINNELRNLNDEIKEKYYIDYSWPIIYDVRICE